MHITSCELNSGLSSKISIYVL